MAAQWVAIEEVTPWDQNPRLNEGAVDIVADSITRFGWGSPILCRGDGVVIAGHTRLKAAHKLGLDKVLVRYMDLDPATAKALALADNKLGEIAEWDDEALAQILIDLDSQDLDLSGLGWSEEELDAILDPPVEGGEYDEGGKYDQIPDQILASTKPGEVVNLGRHRLHCRDCLEVMRELDDNSVDAIVTDPPYGIGFMGKDWDCAVPGEAFAVEALRVLKPGGHLIAFAACRTVHRLAVSVEDAGFEIRDMIGWLQWQGFPKSHDVSKALDSKAGAEREVVGRGKSGKNAIMGGLSGFEIGSGHDITTPATPEAKKWAGWGTALKPAQEPALLARKPLEGTIADNVLKWGTGGINIDGCRIAYGDPSWPGPQSEELSSHGGKSSGANSGTGAQIYGYRGATFRGVRPGQEIGRWPANIYHCPKPSRGEREAGCDELTQVATKKPGGPEGWKEKALGNHHPTVKPIQLMRWLVRLVTPPGATVLEPFCGSGTTLVAAELEGVICLAVEMEPKYCDIIRARYQGALNE